MHAWQCIILPAGSAWPPASGGDQGFTWEPVAASEFHSSHHRGGFLKEKHQERKELKDLSLYIWFYIWTWKHWFYTENHQDIIMKDKCQINEWMCEKKFKWLTVLPLCQSHRRGLGYKIYQVRHGPAFRVCTLLGDGRWINKQVRKEENLKQ